jgi:ATP-dependent DNA ligase
LSWFEALSRREAADTAILYAFDLIEHDGEDMRNHTFLDCKAALARLLRNTEAGILRTPAGLAPRASCQRRSTAPIDPALAASGSLGGPRGSV